MKINFKQLLTEAYNSDITWNKFGDKITPRMKGEGIHNNHQEEFKNRVHAADPTDHKEYGVWIASRYASGGINKLEDLGRTNVALKAFHTAKIRKQLAKNGINADINSYKKLSDLEDAVDNIPKEQVESKTASQIKNEDATHHEDEHWHFTIPHTEDASKKYGAGTRWCTAADQNCMFNHYHEQGPLVIMTPKNPTHDKEKYQYHGASGSFMDSKDDEADLSKILRDRPSSHMIDTVANTPGVQGSPARAVLEHGNDHQINTLLKNTNDLHMQVDAIKSKPSTHAMFVDHPNHIVRGNLALWGGPENRKKLYNDPHELVRMAARGEMD